MVVSSETELEARIAALEATVAELQQTVAALREALTNKPVPNAPTLRSRGMLDRPKTGR